MQIKNSYSLYICLSIFCLIIIGAGVLVYLNWFDLILASQKWQRSFHSSLNAFLFKVKSDPLETGLLLIGLSFLYGVLHSAGPGHGKVIITTYLATQPSKLKKSLLLTLLSAIMQGIVAIGLVSIFVIILKLSPKKLNISEYWLEFGSYIMVIFIGLFICYRSINKMMTRLKATPSNKLKINAIKPLSLSAETITTDHMPIKLQHNELSTDCACCGHRHLPSTQEISQSTHWYTDLAIIISIGLRPCSGALLVLIFAYSIGVYSWGIIATLAMSIGTAATTSLFALFVYCARQLAQRLVKRTSSKSHQLLNIGSSLLTVIGGILFILIGTLLLLGMDFNVTTTVNPIIG